MEQGVSEGSPVGVRTGKLGSRREPQVTQRALRHGVAGRVRKDTESMGGGKTGVERGENEKPQGNAGTLTPRGAKAIVAGGTVVAAAPSHSRFAQALATMRVAL